MNALYSIAARLLFVVLLGLTLVPAAAVVGAEVSFRREAVTSAAIVRLADVADVRGTTAEVEALKSVLLFPAPEPGAVRTFKAREVQELLTLHGVESRSVRFTGASVTTVRAVLEPNAVQAIAKAPTFTAAVVPVSAAKPVLEKTPAPVEMQTVVTAARALKRGDILQRDDVVLKTVPMSKALAAKVSQMEDAVGQELSRNYNVGEAFDAAALRQPILVRRGEMVSVTLHGGGVSVRSSAQSLDEGGRGALVLVQSLLGHKEKFLARVVDFQAVEVMAPAATVSTANNSR